MRNRNWLKTYKIYDNIEDYVYTFYSPIKWNAQIGVLKRVYGDLCVIHTVKYKPRIVCIFRANKN